MMKDGGKIKVSVKSTDREENESYDEELIEVRPDPKALLTGFTNS
jgi:hypothetical protein